MASAFVKSNRMKRTESKKSHSWWWDSHVSPKNSKWLQDNLEEMDQHVKRMVKLIEEDADSFAKKAELYFKKRPELISLVEDFYRMYRSLAERYDHVTGELRKNIPSDLQSLGSGISDVGSEPPSSTMPSPDRRPVRTKSGPRAAGFDFFLGSNGSCSDLNSKEGDESSTLDSESESDDSSVNNYSATQSNGEEQGSLSKHEEISEGFFKNKYDRESCEFAAKITAYEVELRVAKETIQQSSEEITRLTIELQTCKSLGDSNMLSEKKDLEVFESNTIPEQNGLQGSISGSEVEVGLSNTIQTLEKKLRTTQEKLRESEEEIVSLRREITTEGSAIQNFQDQLKTTQKEISVLKSKCEREKREVSRIQDRIGRYKTNLSERDQEIRGLKESISDANKSLSEENEQLRADITRLTKERAYLEDNLKEMDFRCQSSEEDVRRVKAAKDEMEIVLEAQIQQLRSEIAENEGVLEEINKNLDEFKMSYVMLIAVKDDLNAKLSSKDEEIAQMSTHLQELIVRAEVARKRVEELEMELEKKQEIILEGAEEKREAIRQLCLSIEHYRSGYHQLRQAVIKHKRPAVMAA